MKERSHTNRRRFLRCGLGVALSLPAFESLASSASNRDESPRRLVCIGNHLGYYPGNFFPKDAGPNFQISPTLQPVERHRKDFTVFSNLDDGNSGGHKGVHAFLSGIRKEESAGFPEKNITLDQAAAEHVGSETRYASLTAGLGDGTNLVWTRAGINIPPINNPALLFQALFVDVNRKELATQRRRLLHRASVLDALRESAGALNRQLNAADRNKLDQYLTSVRDVERRLRMSVDWLDRPKPKAPIKPVLNEERRHVEEIPLFYDLLALALQTDSTRVATFEIPISFRTSELNVGSYHGLSHHSKEEGRIEQLSVVEKYLMAQFAHLIDRLKEAQVFDDTLIVFGSGMSDGSRHSNRDLPVLLAGGGLNHGGHVICPREGNKRIPLSNLWLSILQWFGLRKDRFGKSTGAFSAMKID